MRIRAWAPGHATLFFAVPEEKSNYLEMGSLGGGLNFTHGVLTAIEPAESNVVKWNNNPIDGIVTKTVLEEFKSRTNFSDPVMISHYSELPIGYGLSTSGAGAIGTALVLGEFADNPLSKIELYQIAHIADAKNQTGLGSVMGQITSGIELRTKIGGPGIGKTKRFESGEKIVILCLGPLSTKDLLRSKQQMEQITNIGEQSVKKALEIDEKPLTSIFEIGQNFTNSTGLRTERINKFLEKLNQINEDKAVMAQIGETLVIHPYDGKEIIKLARKYDIQAIVTHITTQKPQIIK